MRHTIHLLSWGSLGALRILIFLSAISHISAHRSEVYEVPFYSLGSVDVLLTFYVDGAGLIFLRFVLAISSAVLLFSGRYIKEDFFIVRFVNLVLLFVLRIRLLITRLNMVRILLG